jgi:hypothetical protein
MVFSFPFCSEKAKLVTARIVMVCHLLLCTKVYVDTVHSTGACCMPSSIS